MVIYKGFTEDLGAKLIPVPLCPPSPTRTDLGIKPRISALKSLIITKKTRQQQRVDTRLHKFLPSILAGGKPLEYTPVYPLVKRFHNPQYRKLGSSGSHC
jgi:hypothetical protein